MPVVAAPSITTIRPRPIVELDMCATDVIDGSILTLWRRSTNLLERVNKEIKLRTDVVGVFPNPAALIKLAGSVLIEQHSEKRADLIAGSI